MDGVEKTTVIIQLLGKGEKKSQQKPELLWDGLGKKDNDPTRFILDRVEALNGDGRPEKRKVKVYLGLIAPPNGTLGQAGYWTEGTLKPFARANGDFAKKAASRYKGSSAFGGWYIPLEN